jgi:hypothetical protein
MAKVRDNDSRKLETVLVMQGGGSLGAYECGVYRLFQNMVKNLILLLALQLVQLLLPVSQTTILQRSLRISG